MRMNKYELSSDYAFEYVASSNLTIEQITAKLLAVELIDEECAQQIVREWHICGKELEAENASNATE